MRHVLGGLVWVLLLGPSLVCCQTCTYNNTVLTGSNFEVVGIVDPSFNCADTVPLLKQQGVVYSLPELRVVANTTVTFNITISAGTLGFGLTLSPSSVMVSSGDALGLTPTADSVSARACRAFPETLMINNTFAHNYTGLQYTAQPCVLTWQVPLPNTNNYSYFVHDGGYSTPPRRIYIVNSTDVPSSSSSAAASSSSSSSSSSAANGPSSSSSTSSSGSSSPVSSSTSGTDSSSTPTLGPGSSTSGSGTGTGSSPSLSSSSIGTSSSSSSSSSPNGAGASVNAVYGAVAVVVAVIFTMVSA